MKNKRYAAIMLAVLLTAGTALSGCGGPAAMKEDEPAAEESSTVPAEPLPAEKASEENSEPEEGVNPAAEPEEPEPMEETQGPKKYITFSFDDGITQDRRIIEIMKKYGCPCTFNINTGLLGENWDWVGEVIDCPGLSHLRWTEEELRTGIYDGFDVEVHTLTHAPLKDLKDDEVITEVGDDAGNIVDMTGIVPLGIAYPGGESQVADHTIDVIVSETDIRFARCTTSTYAFGLPEYFMEWYPTCELIEGNRMELVTEFLESDCEEDMLLYIWGHGYELDAFDLWDSFEEMIRTVTEAAKNDSSIVLISNRDFYLEFKDRIPAWKTGEET